MEFSYFLFKAAQSHPNDPNFIVISCWMPVTDCRCEFFNTALPFEWH